MSKRRSAARRKAKERERSLHETYVRWCQKQIATGPICYNSAQDVRRAVYWLIEHSSPQECDMSHSLLERILTNAEQVMIRFDHMMEREVYRSPQPSRKSFVKQLEEQVLDAVRSWHLNGELWYLGLIAAQRIVALRQLAPYYKPEDLGLNADEVSELNFINNF